jgi:hypothetical protein
MNTNQITYLDPNQLILHPLVKAHPGEWSDDDPRFKALCDDIHEHGITDPIKITPTNQVADGRHRWRAARKLKLHQVPCQIVPEDQVKQIIRNSLIQRRHFSPGQLCYIFAEDMVPAFQESHRRMLAGIKVNPSLPEGRVGSEPITVEDWAELISVHPNTVRQGFAVYQAFQQHPDIKADWEPKILDPHDPVGIGRAHAGIKGELSTQGKPKAPNTATRQLSLFQDVFENLNNRFTYWTTFDDHQKRQALAPMRTTVENMPDDLLQEFSRAIKSEIKNRQTEA